MVDFTIKQASIDDATEILELQKIAFLSEAKLYNCLEIAPRIEPIEHIKKDIQKKIVLKVVIDDKIVGAIRGVLKDDTCQITRFCVHPDKQNQGIGTMIFREIEKYFPAAKRYELWTGNKSEKNLYLYQRLGYKIFKTEKFDENWDMVYLEKITEK